ncbi:MAG TPA: hypothetical protein VFP84_08495 [Kofleriaceae bacterium]|nr:hypothetical protein [Kofleriaceae bacterium]
MMVDDGLVPPPRYSVIAAAMRDQAAMYPHGISILCILPPETRPPSDEVKRAVKETLTRVTSSLGSLAYLVEGTGFKGVAARASLVGMKIFAARPYPIYVETSMTEAVAKILPHLIVGRTVASDVSSIVTMINDARMTWIPPQPAPRVTGVTTK